MRPSGSILRIISNKPSIFGGVQPCHALWFWIDEIIVYWPEPLTARE